MVKHKGSLDISPPPAYGATDTRLHGEAPASPVQMTSPELSGYYNAGLQPDHQDGNGVTVNIGNLDTPAQSGPAKQSKVPAGEADDAAASGSSTLDVGVEDDDGGDERTCSTVFSEYRALVFERIKRHWTLISRIVKSGLFVMYNIYLIFALKLAIESEQGVHFCDGVGFLLIITGLAYFAVLYYVVLKPAYIELQKTKHAQTMHKYMWQPMLKLCQRIWANRWVRLGTGLVVLVAILVYLILDTERERSRIISACGVVVFVFFSWVCSNDISKVVWRHVIWGLVLQVVFGILILRIEFGQQTFRCIGDKVNSFLGYTDDGSKFVFGFLADKDNFLFAFQVLPVIIFFSFAIQILYYYGIMQHAIVKIGWLLQVSIGTTACESLNAAANIFIGQSEAPLLVKPYLSRLTRSEIHAIMTGGFATIAGSVLAAYVRFGVSASHLLSASVMSAPAALAISKLVYPETERSRTTIDDIKIQKGEEVNALDAAARGAMSVVKICGYIAASLIAFIAFIAFVNGILGWFGELVGFKEAVGAKLSFELIASYVFRPVAWLMGVPWAECGHVGELIALKTILNEFVAYAKLTKMVEQGLLSLRSTTIATYALCGFSNLGAIGIQISGLSAMAPERRSDFARLALSAMMAGNVACFMTACVAGTLINDPSTVTPALAALNVTAGVV